MTCKEIKNTLPAYLEDVLSPEEKKQVAEHLAACPHCSRALADLKTSGKLLRDLAEVEPPPFFKQKIMARVREEARQQGGFIKKLFYPFHIKIPVQAFAAVIIAVLAFQVYRTGEPEVQRLAPLPAPVYEAKKDQVRMESPRAPSAPPARALEKKPLVRVPAEKDKGMFAAPPPVSSDEASQGKAKQIREEGMSTAAKPAEPIMGAMEKKASPAKDEEINKAVDRTGPQELIRAQQAPPPEQKGKEDRLYKSESPAGASRLMAVAAGRPASINVAMHVKDAGAAVREVEAILGRLQARIIERQPREKGEILTVQIKGQRVKELFEQLKKIGQIGSKEAPPDISERQMTVRLEIVGNH